MNGVFDFFFDSSCVISINDLRVWVHLGCSEAEKQNAQLVSFNIDIYFKEPPKGTVTDNLDDTICYLKITEKVQDLCTKKSFSLFEHLAYEAYQSIETLLDGKIKNISKINVTLHKLAPPAPGVHGGVKFTYTKKIA